jgi:hypothetical protein
MFVKQVLVFEIVNNTFIFLKLLCAMKYKSLSLRGEMTKQFSLLRSSQALAHERSA